MWTCNICYAYVNYQHMSIELLQKINYDQMIVKLRTCDILHEMVIRHEFLVLNDLLIDSIRHTKYQKIYIYLKSIYDEDYYIMFDKKTWILYIINILSKIHGNKKLLLAEKYEYILMFILEICYMLRRDYPYHKNSKFTDYIDDIYKAKDRCIEYISDILYRMMLKSKLRKFLNCLKVISYVVSLHREFDRNEIYSTICNIALSCNENIDKLYKYINYTVIRGILFDVYQNLECYEKFALKYMELDKISVGKFQKNNACKLTKVPEKFTFDDIMCYDDLLECVENIKKINK